MADVILLAETEVGVLIEAKTGKCTKLPVAIAENNVKCLLDQQTANRFIAATVLRIRGEALVWIRRVLKGQISERRVLIKIKMNLMP